MNFLMSVKSFISPDPTVDFSKPVKEQPRVHEKVPFHKIEEIKEKIRKKSEMDPYWFVARNRDQELILRVASIHLKPLLEYVAKVRSLEVQLACLSKLSRNAKFLEKRF